MKLQDELTNIENTFKANLPKIENHILWLQGNGSYKDFNTRLTFDCLYSFIGCATLCDWYRKYDCNVNHIATVGKRALSNLGII